LQNVTHFLSFPDRTLSQARKYIFDSLGAEYLESAVLDLEAMLEESDNRVPLICLLSTGSDPSPQIEGIAKNRLQELHQLSMGQGQEAAARKMMQVLTMTNCSRSGLHS
jgi:dynein heavy chain